MSFNDTNDITKYDSLHMFTVHAYIVRLVMMLDRSFPITGGIMCLTRQPTIYR